MTCAIGCAVLAAGASRRLGRPKQLVLVDGVPLLRRAVIAAVLSCPGRAGVVLGASATDIALVLDGLEVERVDNAEWEEGMASSVRAAAAWAGLRGFDAVLLAVADQSQLSAHHLDALMAASHGGKRAAASSYGGQLGVPAVFPRAWYQHLAGLRGDVGARHLLRAAHARVFSVDWPAGAADVDTPGDVPRDP